MATVKVRVAHESVVAQFVVAKRLMIFDDLAKDSHDIWLVKLISHNN